MDYPRQLIAAGAADESSLYQYALGKLVLWVPADSALDLEHKGMRILLDSSVKKIAVANPQHAPYGRAAIAALKQAGVYDQVADRLVLGENVSQAAQFVESGNAQAGFVALAHAVAPGMRGKGKYWEVPLDLYPPLAQGSWCSHIPNIRRMRRSLWSTSRPKKWRSCFGGTASRCRRNSVSASSVE